MKKLHWIWAALFIAACGGGADVGEECDTPGDADECVDGAICTNSNVGSTCLPICTDEAQCAANENCNGISGSNVKSCQVDDSKK
jgi:hypothetical protein